MLWESPWGGKKGRSVIATPSLWKRQKSGLVPVHSISQELKVAVEGSLGEADAAGGEPEQDQL